MGKFNDFRQEISSLNDYVKNTCKDYLIRFLLKKENKKIEFNKLNSVPLIRTKIEQLMPNGQWNYLEDCTLYGIYLNNKGKLVFQVSEFNTYSKYNFMHANIDDLDIMDLLDICEDIEKQNK